MEGKDWRMEAENKGDEEKKGELGTEGEAEYEDGISAMQH